MENKPKISITYETSNGNNILLMTMLWEMLERPDIIRSGLSNLCTKANFEWLLDEIMAFKDYIYEWSDDGGDEEEGTS